MALKKKVKLTAFEKAKKAIDEDRWEQKPGADLYQTPEDIQTAAQGLQMSADRFRSEEEYQSFLKMNSEERSAFLKELEARKKKKVKIQGL